MTSKAKNSDVRVLKGQEAEDAILQYLKKMNRPFGAIDVSANLKGAVQKATTQKILLALAEKGEIVQKAYGKTNLFVANQSIIPVHPAAELLDLETQYKSLESTNNVLLSDIRSAQAELSSLKNSPTDEDLESEIASAKEKVDQLTATLIPLRTGGAPLVSSTELEEIDVDWTKWRAEWVRRRKTFMTFWQLATDSLPPQDAELLIEDLGIEFDTTEHKTLEKGPLCAVQVQGTNARGSLKRKRA